MAELLGAQVDKERVLQEVAVLVDRSGGATDLGCRLETLLRVQAETFAPESCPLCAADIPIRKPGNSKPG